jgi:2-polyprenyl-3-methyl-5-hydroxy-6-metoxy-1,4-benzoquinol methylase
MWLDPFPLAEDIHYAYESYPTHEVQPIVSHVALTTLNRLKRFVRESYLDVKYRRQPENVSVIRKLGSLLAYLAPLRRADIDLSLMLLPIRKGGRLLEVGCGSGGILKFLQEAGWEAHGLDNDPDAVNSARRGGILDVELGSLAEQEYPANHFDAVALCHVLEHIFDPAELVRECHRILKPGGHLVIITPNSQSLGHRLFKQHWIHLHPPNHLYIFRRHTLHQLAISAGFENARCFSSIRWADQVFLGSSNIKRFGHSKEPNATCAWAKTAALLEWLIGLCSRNVGEECNLIAEKGVAHSR